MKSKRPDAQAWQRLIEFIFVIMPITQRQFAKEIGVAHNSVHGWLNGRTKPRPEYQLAIIAYCIKNKMENLCEKCNLGDIVKQVKELGKQKKHNPLTIEIPANLLSVAPSKAIIKINGIYYAITIEKTKRG